MRWEELFADVAGRWAEHERLEREAEVADRLRAELAQVRLVDRLRAAGGRPVELHVSAGPPVRGEVLDCAPQWVLLAVAPGVAGGGAAGRVLVPLAAVLAARGVPSRTAGPPSQVQERRGLTSVLRSLAVGRHPVRVRTTLSEGALGAGGTLHGTFERVGADHVDLVQHGRDELPGRAGAVSTISLRALVAVSDAGGEWWG